MENMDNSETEGLGLATGEPRKKKRQRHSDNWGGAREGSGRRPNDVPTLWMQVAVSMTKNDAEAVTALSPGQRANRLLNPAPYSPELENAVLSVYELNEHSTANTSLSDGPVERRPYNFRVALNTLDERMYILKMSVPERTRRLLTLPMGDIDPEDERKGKWYGKSKV